MDRATVIQTVGLPHSEIPGSWVVGTYPGLFAADHVRPSSSGGSKASSVDPFSLDHIALPIPDANDFKNRCPLLGGMGIRTPDPRLAKPML